MKKTVKRLLLRLAPSAAGALVAWRQRRHARQFEARLGLPALAEVWTAHHDLCVLDGPFAGMRYVPRAVGSAFVPKLLGSYESELHSIMDRAANAAYALIVDIGCAEGYYAVGLARRLPRARVYAFDTDAAGRALCAAMARANDVAERVIVGGACNTKALSDLLGEQRAGAGAALVVCDCEGCEYDLLRPDQAPGLRGADLLVELHPGGDDDAARRDAAFLESFSATHDVTLLTAQGRDPARYPAVHFLPVEQQRLAVNEFRHAGQRWAWMLSRRSRRSDGASGKEEIA